MPRGRTEKTLALIAECSEILEAIQPASIRAVCYQLFTRGLIPNMSKTATNQISDILARAVSRAKSPGNGSSTSTAMPNGCPLGRTPKTSPMKPSIATGATAGSISRAELRCGRRRGRSVGRCDRSSMTTA